MNWFFPVACSLYFFAVLPSIARSQCSSMVGTPLQSCSVAGYNSTFPMPYKVDNKTERSIRWFIDYIVKMTASNNCSKDLQRIGEIITCAMYVPKCQDGNLILPCKRVCVEYLKKCDGFIDPFWFDYFIAHCTLLPDFYPASGQCFEPPNFEKTFNTSSTDILHGNCHKLIFPWCKNLGYEYTIMKESTQMNSYRILYGKNFTNTSQDKIYRNNSGIHFYTNFQKNYSKCSTHIQKMLCADLFPPCYPGEGTAMYSICHETCLDMRNRCPGIAQHDLVYLGNFFDSCEAMATEKPSHGYCKRTAWPKPMLWLNYFKARIPPKKKSSPPSPPVPAYVIVIVVTLPMVAIGSIVALFLWRQRKLPWFVRIFKKNDDTKDIIEDDVADQVPIEDRKP